MNSKKEIFPFNHMSETDFKQTLRQIRNRTLVLQYSLNIIPLSHEKRWNFLKLSQEAMNMSKDGWKVIKSKLTNNSNNSNFYFKPYKSKTFDDVCPICQEKMKSTKTSFQLKCGHGYHINCMSKQLEHIGPSYNLCPICRKDIIT